MRIGRGHKSESELKNRMKTGWKWSLQTLHLPFEEAFDFWLIRSPRLQLKIHSKSSCKNKSRHTIKTFLRNGRDIKTGSNGKNNRIFPFGLMST